MTPGEVNLRAYYFYKNKEEEERAIWQREAHFTAQIMNASGRMKRKAKGSDLYRVGKDGGAAGVKGKSPITAEERRRQALETFKFHKSKAWGMISDKSLAALTADIETQNQSAEVKP